MSPLKLKLTRENVFQVFHSRGQLTVLNDSILHIFQVLYGVDALLPVFAHISQRVLDIFDVHQGTVQLGQPSTNTIQLGLNGCLRDVRGHVFGK